MRILLTGHGCAPNMGSEPGVTWNWAVNLAKTNDVWVITHEYFRPAIESYLAAHPMPRLHFTYVGRLGRWDMLHLPSLRGIRLHYLFWRHRVLKIARELDEQHDFDIMHHVSWNTVSSPPLLWRLNKPFVWGPVGGGQVTPVALLGGYGLKLPFELLRTLRVRLLHLSPSVRKATSKAAALFSVNQETANILHRAGASTAPLLLDVGIPRHILDMPLLARPTEGPFIVLWAAIIEPRKGLGLCLEAARLVKVPDVKFVIVGDGPQAAAARRQAQRLGIENKVEFRGRIPWPDLQMLYRTAHVFLFTSIRDSYGTAPLEALAAGAPLICLDHQGADVHLPDDVAVRIPLGRPRAIAAATARAIDNLAQDRGRLAEMSCASRRYAETEAWDSRAASMQRHYASLVRDGGKPLQSRPSAARSGAVFKAAIVAPKG
jgi:glycosyltransferase involved in cell wall biosynthesis